MHDLNALCLESEDSTLITGDKLYHDTWLYAFFYINVDFTILMKVIGKLSEGKASHVPYRDSKLTRLLQSSLSGHGHVSVSSSYKLLFCITWQRNEWNCLFWGNSYIGHLGVLDLYPCMCILDYKIIFLIPLKCTT